MTHQEYIQRLKDSPFNDEFIQDMLGYITKYPNVITESIKMGQIINDDIEGDTMDYVAGLVGHLENKIGVMFLTLTFMGSSQEIWDNYVSYKFFGTLKMTQNGLTYVYATE
jgi:hypothetical protein